MPTVEELDRLAALAARLEPLARAARGELIRADNWNVLVGAVIEVARALLAKDRVTDVPPHDHSEQVKLSWLEPRLRSLIESGPLADPLLNAKSAEAERNVKGFSARLDKTNGDLERLRERLSEVTTRDLLRESDVREVRRAVTGLSDSRDDVMNLRRTLDGLTQQLGVVLAAAERLTVNGQPVDLGAFSQRLTDLEQLRQRLTSPSGELFDAAALERRLTQLANDLVTEDELDAALESRPGRLDPDQVSALSAELTGRFANDIRVGLEQSEARQRAELTTRLAGINQLVAQAVGDARTALAAELSAATATSIRDANEQLRAELISEIGKRTTAAADALRAETNERLKAFDGMEARLTQQIDTRVAAGLASLRAADAELDARATLALSRLDAHDGALLNLEKSVVEAREEATRERARLQATLIAEMDRQRVELGQRLDDLDRKIDERIKNGLAAERASLEKFLAETVNKSVDARIQETRSSLKDELTQSMRSEVLGVESRLNASLDAQVKRTQPVTAPVTGTTLGGATGVTSPTKKIP